MNSKVLYTAIYGNKDSVKIHDYQNPDFDYLLFVDKDTFEAQKETILSSNWKWQVLENDDNPRMAAKDMKLRSHNWVQRYDTSIWVDGSFNQIGDLNEFIALTDKNFAAMRHPNEMKNCLYQEAAACVNQQMDDPAIINRQVNRYREEGYPSGNGLLMGGILLRNRDEAVSRFNEMWYKEVENGSIRDQISFPYVAWKMGYEMGVIDFEKSQLYFDNKPHMKK